MQRTQIVAGNSMGILHRVVLNHKFSPIFLKEWTIAMNYRPEYSPHKTNFNLKFRVALTPSRNMSPKVRAVQNNTCLKNSQKCRRSFFWSRIHRKARNFVEFRRQVFALLLLNTVYPLPWIEHVANKFQKPIFFLQEYNKQRFNRMNIFNC